MVDFLKKIRIFNGNALKIIAAVTMFLDHFGLMFYPQNMVFRAIGRLAMPLFAFMLAEGARYTRNKTKHFLMLFGLGAICQIVYFVFSGDTYLNILITFSMSTLILYALDWLKTSFWVDKNKKLLKVVPPPLMAGFLLILAVLGAYFVCKFCTVDYGFWGCLLPVFANLLNFRSVRKELGEATPKILEKLDVLPLRVACFAVGAALLYFCAPYDYLPTEWLFLTIPILFLYNGERGKVNMKYFFYLFYPLHLALLEGLWMFIYGL